MFNCLFNVDIYNYIFIDCYIFLYENISKIFKFMCMCCVFGYFFGVLKVYIN